MGHAVNSIGFRLLAKKHWRTGCSLEFHTLLDSLFFRFFDIRSSSFLYSHTRSFFSPLSNQVRVSVYLYSHLWAQFLRRRAKIRLRLRHRSKRQFKFSRRRRFQFTRGYRWVRPPLRRYRIIRRQLLMALSRVITTLLCRVIPSFRWSLRLYLVSSSPLSPSLLVRSTSVKLKRHYRLDRVLNSLVERNLHQFSKRGVAGFFFKASGRFSRSQRATSFSLRKGVTPFSTTSILVDWFSIPFVLKYGCCTLQVWVTYRPSWLGLFSSKIRFFNRKRSRLRINHRKQLNRHVSV